MYVPVVHTYVRTYVRTRVRTHVRVHSTDVPFGMSVHVYVPLVRTVGTHVRTRILSSTYVHMCTMVRNTYNTG